MMPFYQSPENDFRIFYSNNLTFPSHLHSQVEMLYVIKGKINVTINRDTKKLSEGCFAIIFPNIIHSYDYLDDSQVSLLAIFDLNQAGDFLKKLTTYYPTDPFLTPEQLHDNVPYAFRELEKEVRNGQNPLVYRSLVQLILSRTIPVMKLIKNHDIQNYDLTYKIVSYISQNFQEPITLADLATHLNVSKYHLSRTFSSKLNTSFNKYLNYIRLNYAQTLIQSTTNTLIQISTEAGFDSQRTFNRAFKEIFHMSPSEYRRRDEVKN